MSTISDNLIHFLGRNFKESPKKQLDIFKSIIINGLKCGTIKIKFSEGGFVQNNVVCFTDIPLSKCDEHAAIYGKFGIGFKKSFVKNHGGNPARYFVDYLPGGNVDEHLVENRGLLYMNICSHFKLVKQIGDLLKSDDSFSLCDKNGTEIFGHDAIKVWHSEQLANLSFEKETGDLGPARDETKEIDLYYKEREWRLVPFQANIISGSVKISDDDGAAYYKFNRNDLNVIVTPNDEIRTEVLMFLLSLSNKTDPRLKDFSENPLPVITYDDLKKW